MNKICGHTSSGLLKYRKRLQIVSEHVDAMPGIELPIMPQGAFYAFLRIDGLIGKSNGSTTINSASDFANYLIEEKLVVIVPGEAFGDGGGFRISIAVDEETLAKGLGKIAQAAGEFS